MQEGGWVVRRRLVILPLLWSPKFKSRLPTSNQKKSINNKVAHTFGLCSQFHHRRHRCHHRHHHHKFQFNSKSFQRLLTILGRFIPTHTPTPLLSLSFPNFHPICFVTVVMIVKRKGQKKARSSPFHSVGSFVVVIHSIERKAKKK